MKVALLGAGNVATNLALALHKAKVNVVQVWSNTHHNATLLASKIGAEAVEELASLQADICLLAIKDDAITIVLDGLRDFHGIVAHTAGAVSINVFAKKANKYGVFYPLQTFSKTRAVDFSTVPICLEADGAETLQVLTKLGNAISNNVSAVSSAQRKILHVAAVFACNFPNYLFGKADELLGQHSLDFNLLRPLILETALKVQQNSPANVQTGPAIRKDEATMQAHLELLNGNKTLTDIYNLLSESIKSGK